MTVLYIGKRYPLFLVPFPYLYIRARSSINGLTDSPLIGYYKTVARYYLDKAYATGPTSPPAAVGGLVMEQPTVQHKSFVLSKATARRRFARPLR
jgi:hypothetical protein